MAKPTDDLKTRIDNLRPLPLYDEDEDLSDSVVEHRDALVAKALEDRTLATKLLKTFEAVVDKVPPTDRVVIVRWVAVVALALIAGFVVLKATHTW